MFKKFKKLNFQYDERIEHSKNKNFEKQHYSQKTYWRVNDKTNKRVALNVIENCFQHLISIWLNLFKVPVCGIPQN